MKYKVFLLLVLLGISALMWRCEDPLDGETFISSSEVPAAMWLEQHPGYSEWVALLKRANVYNTLNVNATYTIFAADNDAVAEYLKNNGYASVEEVPVSVAENLMKYHIIPGVKYAHGTFNGKIATETASGDVLSVTIREGGINAMYVNDVSLILEKDIEVINGYIHILEKVLEPIMSSVWDVLNEPDNGFTVFRDAVKETGYDSLLDSRTLTLLNVALKDYKSVFVVPDEVFRANGIESFADLKARFPGDALKEYIGYHIINSYEDFAALAEMYEGQSSKCYRTYATNKLLLVELAADDILLNGEARLQSGKYNIQARNGYLHCVDGLLAVKDPGRAVYTEWEFTENWEFRILEYWRQYSASRRGNTYALDRKNATTIAWRCVPDNDEAVTYKLYSQNNSAYPYENDDLLRVDLGSTGWLEMEMPALPAGTYRVTVVSRGWSSGDGNYQLSIDYKKLGTPITMSGLKESLGEVTFEKTESHLIRLTLTKTGHIELDRLIFEPK